MFSIPKEFRGKLADECEKFSEQYRVAAYFGEPENVINLPHNPHRALNTRLNQLVRSRTSLWSTK
jgi:hypothetical protein